MGFFGLLGIQPVCADDEDNPTPPPSPPNHLPPPPLPKKSRRKLIIQIFCLDDSYITHLPCAGFVQRFLMFYWCIGILFHCFTGLYLTLMP